MSAEHEDTEVNIGKKRLLIFLDRVQSQYKIALSLGYILANDGEKLRGFIDDELIESLLSACWKYMESNVECREINDSLIKIIKMQSRKENIYTEPKMDTNLSEELCKILCLPHVLALAKEYFEMAPENVKLFMSLIEEITGILQEKLTITTEEQRGHEKQLYRTWRQNNYYLKRIEELTAILKAEDEMINVKLNSKKILSNELTKKMSRMHESSDLQIMITMNKSEVAMSEEAIASEARHDELEQEAHLVTQKYQQLLDQHLQAEKVLRVKRYKVETQLSNWLNKYDTEIGELQQQLEDVRDGYETELNTFKELKQKFNEQEELYNELMAEKEEEERLIFVAKCYQFILNRSARRIQRWWRSILAKKKLRKKKPKKKGK